MKIEQLYTGCLAQGAYYIESNGEAAIIDPLRETEPYVKKAEENGVKIKYIFETHFHSILHPNLRLHLCSQGSYTHRASVIRVGDSKNFQKI